MMKKILDFYDWAFAMHSPPIILWTVLCGTIAFLLFIVAMSIYLIVIGGGWIVAIAISLLVWKAFSNVITAYMDHLEKESRKNGR